MRADMQRRTLLPKDVCGFQTRERSIDPPGILMMAGHLEVAPIRFDRRQVGHRCLIHGYHQFTGSEVCSARQAPA